MDKSELWGNVLEREFNGFNISYITELSGDAKDTFDVTLEGEELIVHICSENRFEKRFETEDLVLQKVKESSSLPVPKVLASDISKEEIIYVFHF